MSEDNQGNGDETKDVQTNDAFALQPVKEGSLGVGGGARRKAGHILSTRIASSFQQEAPL
jgi:hypothetical protein